MSPDGLNPGDKVVDLAGVSRSAGMISGILLGAVAAWVSSHRFLPAIVWAIASGVAGYACGWGIGKWQFPTAQGMTFIAKAGVSSLPLTLKGALLPSLSIAGLIFLAVSRAYPNTHPERWIVISISFLIGALFAGAASLS